MPELPEKMRIDRQQKILNKVKWDDGYDGGGEHPLPRRDKRDKAIRGHRGWDAKEAEGIERAFGKRRAFTREEWKRGVSKDGKWKRYGGSWRRVY